jgi:hypothetical protein
VENVPAVVDQVTPVLLLPCTKARNCSLPPARRLEEAGEIVTEMPLPPWLEITICARSIAVAPCSSVAWIWK